MIILREYWMQLLQWICFCLVPDYAMQHDPVLRLCSVVALGVLREHPEKHFSGFTCEAEWIRLYFPGDRRFQYIHGCTMQPDTTGPNLSLVSWSAD
jgi:hypothetical protein